MSGYAPGEIAPLTDLPAWMREEIEQLAAQSEAPPKWREIAGGWIVSRGWLEWHLRRGANPLRTYRESISKRLRTRVIERDGHVCQLCGGDVDPAELQLDHRIPVSKGGPSTFKNLQVTHGSCNRKKGARL